MKTPKSNAVNNADKCEEKESAKKLVQARLPFKVITTPTTDEAIESKSIGKVKKRKLFEISNAKQIEEHSDKKKKHIELVSNADDIIVLDDQDNDLEENKSNTSPCKAKTPYIRLPFGSKSSKRRKSAAPEQKSEAVKCSNDTDNVASVSNPRKRFKVNVQNTEKKVNKNLNIEIDTIDLNSDENNEGNSRIPKDNERNEKEQNDNNIKEKKEIEMIFDSKIEKQEDDEISDGKSPENTNIKKSKLNISKNNASFANEERMKCKDEEVKGESEDSSLCLSSSIEMVENVLTNDTGNEQSNDYKKTSDEKPKKPLTKKQMRLKEQRLKSREEKERKLMEEKLHKQRDKEQREECKKREREEKEEQRKREREEKDEKKRQERDEKERKRLSEIETKNEEKRKRNEAKEEEMRKKDEERKRKDLEKQEADSKAKKAAQAFTKFFVAKTEQNSIVRKDDPGIEHETNSPEFQQRMAFRPFQIKGAMKLAPVSRYQLTTQQRKRFDDLVLNEHNGMKVNIGSLYLNELRSGKRIPNKCQKSVVDTKTISSDCEDSDVQVIEDDLASDLQAILVESNLPAVRMCAKFYKFAENRRPPYYGTWRKHSKIITPRKPFAQDNQEFEYDVDSDLEWEEEEPGESLEDSEGEDKDKECEENDDYDVDNEWMVPHGHLSDEELEHEDENVPLGDENTREAQKAKLMFIQQEFAMEMKKRTTKIQPRLVGCIWVDKNGKQPATCSTLIWQSINLRSMLCTQPPLLEECTDLVPEKTVSGDKKQLVLDEKMSQDLIRLVHGNSHSKTFLIKEFIAFIEANDESVRSGEFHRPLKSAVGKKLKKYADWQVTVPEKNDEENQKKKNKHKKRLCWVVHKDILTKKGLESLSLKNEWQYLLKPNKINLQTSAVDVNDSPSLDEMNKKVVENENIVVINKITNTENKPIGIEKNVPIVMSVAREKQICSKAKNALISQFLKKKSDDPVEVENESNVINLD